jgi:hypothetical protein
MASKKSAKSKNGVNKSAWIRQHPGAAVTELVAKAKAEGITISPGLVYAIRSDDKKKAGAGTSKVAKVGAPKQLVHASGLGNFDSAIRTIVREELRALLGKI